MDKALYVRKKFAAIAPRYDATNELLTAGADEGLRKPAPTTFGSDATCVDPGAA